MDGVWIEVTELGCKGDPVEAHLVPVAVGQDQAEQELPDQEVGQGGVMEHQHKRVQILQ